jgi:hypothetical protein
VEGFFPDDLPDSVYDEKFDLITSIAMFYDLPDPRGFVKSISELLEVDGVWHTEQSYLYSMLETNAFDTICHEHLEYYTFAFIEKLCELNSLKIIDVSINKINGGSFALTICKIDSYRVETPTVSWMRQYESNKNLMKELELFANRIIELKNNVLTLVTELKSAKKNIWALGASTKGNVLLSYFGFDKNFISGIVDVNEFKFGRETPGTRIPIFSELQFEEHFPEFTLVLPWHFYDGLLTKHSEYLRLGGKLIFPMPQILIISD